MRPGRPTGRWGYLANAHVLEPYRSRGIGRRLVDALLDHVTEQGFERVVLHPTDRSIPFYRRAGLEPADALMLRRLR